MTRNPLITAIAMVTGLILFAALVVVPRGRQVTSVRSEIADAETQLNLLQAELGSLEAMQNDGQEVARLAGLRKSIPATAAIPELLQSLEQAAGAAGVSLTSISLGAPSASTVGTVSSIPLTLSAVGPYFELAKFLFALEHLDRLMRISSVSLQPGEGKTLSLSVTAETYTTDVSSGPGSDPAPGPEVGA